jgi:hypothetical protein
MNIKAVRIVMHSIMGVLLFSFVIYTMGHHGDGGCDGGLCGILLFIHTVPLIVIWLLTMLMFNSWLLLKNSYWIWLALAGLLSPLMVGAAYYQKELDHPFYFLSTVHLISIPVFLWRKTSSV